MEMIAVDVIYYLLVCAFNT